MNCSRNNAFGDSACVAHQPGKGRHHRRSRSENGDAVAQSEIKANAVDIPSNGLAPRHETSTIQPKACQPADRLPRQFIVARNIISSKRYVFCLLPERKVTSG